MRRLEKTCEMTDNYLAQIIDRLEAVRSGSKPADPGWPETSYRILSFTLSMIYLLEFSRENDNYRKRWNSSIRIYKTDTKINSSLSATFQLKRWSLNLRIYPLQIYAKINSSLYIRKHKNMVDLTPLSHGRPDHDGSVQSGRFKPKVHSLIWSQGTAQSRTRVKSRNKNQDNSDYSNFNKEKRIIRRCQRGNTRNIKGKYLLNCRKQRTKMERKSRLSLIHI